MNVEQQKTRSVSECAEVLLLWIRGADRYAEAIEQSELRGRYMVHACEVDEIPDTAVLERTTVIFCQTLPAGVLRRMPSLRWLQAEAAGVDKWLMRDDLGEELVLTCGRGIHDLQMPDTILGSLFHVSKPFEQARRQQQERRWERLIPDSVGGKTLGIVGLGAIGSTLARKAAGLDMRVLGVNRSGRSVPGVERVFTTSAIDEMLPLADHVVLLLPLTAETENIINSDRLRVMKPTAWLHNFSRGGHIDDEALIASVGRGEVAGAVLDAFREEPLPSTHPFWTTRNIIVLPHMGGHHPKRFEFVCTMLLQNLTRYLHGEPLSGRVNRALGY